VNLTASTAAAARRRSVSAGLEAQGSSVSLVALLKHLRTADACQFVA
jgi:hypothetical protein